MVDNESIEPGKLFVGGLSWETSKESMEAYFSQFGEVSDCVVMKDDNSKPRGFGFVTFVDHSVVNSVLQQKEHILDKKKIDPKHATVKGKGKKHKLFCGGLSHDTTADDLMKYFSALEPSIVKPLSAEVKVNASDGKSKGFGFLEVSSEEGLKYILQKKAKHDGENPKYEINGKLVEMKEANPQESRQRSEKSSYHIQQQAAMYQQLMFQPAHPQYYPGSGMSSFERGGQYPGNGSYAMQYSGNSYPSSNYNYSTQSSGHSPVYSYSQYGGSNTRGYTGQQMSSYPQEASYSSQNSSNFLGNETSYSSGYSAAYGQQGYNYPEQGGGGASPSSYSRPGLNSQPRGSATQGGYPQQSSYGAR